MEKMILFELMTFTEEFNQQQTSKGKMKESTNKKQTRQIWFFIAGMVEMSDSIAYDLLQQKKIIESKEICKECKIIARDINSDNYKIQITSWDEFKKTSIQPKKGDAIIYHYCDGWEEFETYAEELNGVDIYWRWHNNTPPWYMMENPIWIENTLRGFNQLIKATNSGKWNFLVNSSFTKKQLQEISSKAIECSVVYPASVQLEKKIKFKKKYLSRNKKLKLLFVGRMVPHKSHKLILLFAKYIETKFNIKSEINFVGRTATRDYISSLFETSQKLNLELIYHGETTTNSLEEIYSESDLFISFSQHEGFGLPTYEAMRYGLPIIGIYTSAFRELLGDHPLFCEGIDFQNLGGKLNNFLCNQEEQDYLWNYQKKILSSYTLEIVAEQLIKAIDQDSKNNKEINTETLGLESCVHRRAFLPDAQYVQTDDLALFEKILKLQSPFITKTNGKKKLQSSNNKWTYIDSKFFSTIQSQETNKAGLTKITKSHSNSNIFFGPYTTLEPGLYRICFSIAILDPQQKNKEITLDIHNDTNGIIKQKKKLKLRQENSLNMNFIFHVKNPKKNLCLNFDATPKKTKSALYWIGWGY